MEKNNNFKSTLHPAALDLAVADQNTECRSEVDAHASSNALHRPLENNTAFIPVCTRVDPWMSTFQVFRST